MELKNSFNLIEGAWSLKKMMQENKLIMVYNDLISHKTYEHLMNLAEEKLDVSNTSLKNKKKILNILVESMQNIAHHGLKDKGKAVASLFVIGMDDSDNFFVLSGNTINNEQEDYLREKLDHLNSLDSDEMRELYKHSIQQNEYSQKGGAGLGFIDIARKSQSKLNYHFTRLNDHNLFFTFKVDIKSN